MNESHCAPWTCPVCQNELQREERSFRCSEGHTFDLAKEGYVNLLLSGHKKSANPGDDKMMSRCRRGFLEQGHYAPLTRKLSELCQNSLNETGNSTLVLDIGCGEGYYGGQITNHLASLGTKLSDINISGIDISKEAIRLAAKRYKTSHFAVASSSRLPIGDASVDLIYCVFSPFDTEEIQRVLKTTGCFINVHPGPNHLFSLRQQVYDDPRPHEVKSAELNQLSHISRTKLDFDISLGSGDSAQLLAMTPYYWQASADKQLRIAELESLDTPVNFVIDIYQPVS